MKIAIGQQVGKLTIIHIDRHNEICECRCTCGCTEIVRIKTLHSGHKKQCKQCSCNRGQKLTWMQQKLTIKQWASKIGIPEYVIRARLHDGWTVEKTLSTAYKKRERITDIVSNRELYSTWYNMHQRCENPHAHGYENYGGRGVKVCSRWSGKHGFANFVVDMSPRPINTTLDRINSDGDYEQSNCRWADAAMQGLNRRNTRTYTVKGTTKSIPVWAKEVGVAPQTIVDRIAHGFPPEVVLAKVSLASKEGRELLRAHGVDVHTGAPKGSVLIDHPYTVRINGKAYTCIRPDDHPQVPDLIGQTFGQLTVKGMLPGLPVKWLCQCTCGVVRLASTRDLRESVVTACRQCARVTTGKRSGLGGVIDETGHVYGELTVIGRAEDKPGRGAMWTCRCSCGCTVVVNGNLLRKGWTRSCGHLKCSVADQRTRSTWMSMVKRCTDASDPAYTHYGARGVAVCGRWLGLDGLAHFVADMGQRPAGCTLDRIDPEQGYSPSNCRWATAVQQARNKRTTVRVKYKGVDLPVADWAERVGLPAEVVRTRLRRGWTVEAALTTPYRRRRAKGGRDDNE